MARHLSTAAPTQHDELYGTRRIDRRRWVGGRGDNHVRVLSQLGAICAVCGSDAERVRQASRQYSVDGYDSVDRL